ncbi:MAG: hypothetical protein L0Y72_07850 [Gemmataceae bacterium]|nr:hypothetical protein [Gemmataceae bacterium]
MHAYSFDVVSRLTSDAVTALGTNVDGAVRRLEVAYDTGGRANLFTSFDAASGGNIVNQVQRDFNGLGQLTAEHQAHAGAVIVGTTPKVQYAYSEMAGGANHSRLVSMTYPNGDVLNYNYTAALDAAISRLTSLSENSITLEALDYLGLGTVVRRAHSQPGVDLTYIKQTGESNGDAGDQYTGLDRFGRVVDQRWRKTSDGSHTDRFKYGHDRNGNRLFRENVLNAVFSELYHADGATAGYDNLDQLLEFQRGTLSDTNSDNIPDTVATASRSQVWSLDAQGNWSSLNTDGTPVSRTHNKQNQVTAVGSSNLTFDANGNMTTDEFGKPLVFDAWNRLVQVKNSGGSPIATYKYDALNRRIVETVSGSTRDIFFSAAWQVLEEREGSTVKLQYVWSPVYIDALILRDRDADGNTGNGMEERFYVQQDANANVTAIISVSGSVVERFVYDPYGQVTFLNSSWTILGGSAYAWVVLHQGGRLDPATGLYNFRFRDLSVTLGRWLQLDPIGIVAGTNLYRALGNGPTNITDPSGLYPIIEIRNGIAYFEFENGRVRLGYVTINNDYVAMDAEHGGGAISLDALRTRAAQLSHFARPTSSAVTCLLLDARAADRRANQALSGFGRSTGQMPTAANSTMTQQDAAHQGAGPIRVLANVAIAWASAGGTFVGGSRFVFNMNTGRWTNVTANRTATAAEAAAAQRAAMASAQAGSRGVWDLGPVLRGYAIEQRLGGNLPAGFRVIDRFDNGIATSIKSMDLIDANGCRVTVASIRDAGRDYVDLVAAFNGGSRTNQATGVTTTITSNQITGRALEFAVPPGATVEQQATLVWLIIYGRARGVTVNIIEIPF